MPKSLDLLNRQRAELAQKIEKSARLTKDPDARSSILSAVDELELPSSPLEILPLQALELFDAAREISTDGYRHKSWVLRLELFDLLRDIEETQRVYLRG